MNFLMETVLYAEWKAQILSYIPGSPDAQLILLGFALFLVATVIFRLSVDRFSSLLPVFIPAVAMEIADSIILYQPLLHGLRDILWVCAIPAILVVGLNRRIIEF